MAGSAPSHGNGTHDSRISRLLDLLQLLVQTNGGFRTYLPDELRGVQTLVDEHNVLERLGGTKWRLLLRDGTDATVTFEELMILLYNLQKIMSQIQELEQDGVPDVDGAFKLETTLDETVIMQPRIVMELLRGLIQGRHKS